MVKKITALNLDTDIVLQAKAYGLNMSEIAQDAIKEKLGIKKVDIPEGHKCHDCGYEYPKEKASEAKENNNNRLTWIYPEEIWLCNGCLKMRY